MQPLHQRGFFSSKWLKERCWSVSWTFDVVLSQWQDVLITNWLNCRLCERSLILSPTHGRFMSVCVVSWSVWCLSFQESEIRTKSQLAEGLHVTCVLWGMVFFSFLSNHFSLLVRIRTFPSSKSVLCLSDADQQPWRAGSPVLSPACCLVQWLFDLSSVQTRTVLTTRCSVCGLVSRLWCERVLSGAVSGFEVWQMRFDACHRCGKAAISSQRLLRTARPEYRSSEWSFVCTTQVLCCRVVVKWCSLNDMMPVVIPRACTMADCCEINIFQEVRPNPSTFQSTLTDPGGHIFLCVPQ